MVTRQLSRLAIQEDHEDMIKLAAVIMMGVVLPGCINIATSLQPENDSVAYLREASDCVPIILGLGYGTATLENALAEQVLTTEYKGPRQPIAKIRRVQLHDYQFLFFGARCIEVVGE